MGGCREISDATRGGSTKVAASFLSSEISTDIPPKHYTLASAGRSISKQSSMKSIQDP